MADDKSKVGGQDRARVAANEDYEIDHLAKKHGVTREQVLAAIKAVGDKREDVEAYLQKHKK